MHKIQVRLTSNRIGTGYRTIPEGLQVSLLLQIQPTNTATANLRVKINTKFH